MAALHSISKGQLRMQLQDKAGPAVAVYPAFRRVLGLNATAAQFLSQAVYWTERTTDGWFYKTESEWEVEIGLSAKEVRTARKNLAALRLLEEVRKGVPAKIHYRVDVDLLFALLDGQKSITGHAQKVELVVAKGEDLSLPNSTTSPAQKVELVVLVGQDKSDRSGSSITEITQEITQEITAETTAETLSALPADAGSPVVEGELIEAGEETKALVPVQPVTGSAGPRCSIPADMPGPKDQSCKTFKSWANYAMAYRKRYGVWPKWNATSGGLLAKLVDRLGADDAHHVSAYYLTINDARLINDCHSLKVLLAKAEAFHTQWATGRQMNGTTARQIEQTQANINAAQEAARLITEEGERNAFL